MSVVSIVQQHRNRGRSEQNQEQQCLGERPLLACQVSASETSGSERASSVARGKGTERRRKRKGRLGGCESNRHNANSNSKLCLLACVESFAEGENESSVETLLLGQTQASQSGKVTKGQDRSKFNEAFMSLFPSQIPPAI